MPSSGWISFDHPPCGIPCRTPADRISLIFTVLLNSRSTNGAAGRKSYPKETRLLASGCTVGSIIGGMIRRNFFENLIAGGALAPLVGSVPQEPAQAPTANLLERSV